MKDLSLFQGCLGKHRAGIWKNSVHGNAVHDLKRERAVHLEREYQREGRCDESVLCNSLEHKRIFCKIRLRLVKILTKTRAYTQLGTIIIDELGSKSCQNI